MQWMGQVSLNSTLKLWLCLQACFTHTNSTFWKCVGFPFAVSIGLVYSKLDPRASSDLWAVASPEVTWSVDSANFLLSVWAPSFIFKPGLLWAVTSESALFVSLCLIQCFLTKSSVAKVHSMTEAYWVLATVLWTVCTLYPLVIMVLN